LRPKALAEADLTNAVRLEPDNPALYYVRGTCFNVVADLRHAINLLSMSSDVDDMAICTSQPDIYKWHGSDDGELFYLAQRELGSVLEGQGRTDKALVAFERAAAFRVIAQADLERCCEADMQVGRLCEAVIGYRSLTEFEDRAEYRHRLDECERWLREPRRVVGARP
jgi:tetratricopeptide (TPR) repeat protein